jgi:hypothetical protein
VIFVCVCVLTCQCTNKPFFPPSFSGLLDDTGRATDCHFDGNVSVAVDRISVGVVKAARVAHPGICTVVSVGGIQLCFLSFGFFIFYMEIWKFWNFSHTQKKISLFAS